MAPAAIGDRRQNGLIEPPAEPSDPARRAQRARGARTAWAVVVGFIGALALGVLVAGIVAVGAYGLLRAEGGSFRTGERALASSGYAISSGDFDLGVETTGIDLGRLASFELALRGSAERPIFVGVGPSASVDHYLAGVAHSEVDDFDRRGRPLYTQLAGGPPPTPPAAQSFWVSRSQGPGLQRVTWDLGDGSLTAVAMNADGSRGVGVDGQAGVRLGWLLGAGIAAIVLGLLAAVACGFGMNRLLRPEPAADPVQSGVFG